MDDVCFKIEKNLLFLEKELVEFNIPIFFICNNEENIRYSVLCVDSENLRYLVVQSDTEDILSMLKAEISMKELFLKGKKAWEIEAGEDYNSDIVKKAEVSFIKAEDLPQEGAYFDLKNEKIKEYIKFLKKENDKFDSIEILAEYTYLRLPVYRNTIDYIPKDNFYYEFNNYQEQTFMQERKILL